jgi:Mn2+/Fe2+ NRAMP family transporter
MAIWMQNDRVRRVGLPWYRRWGRWVLWATVGHGYRPWLAGIWAAGMIAAFALVVSLWPSMFVATKQGVSGSPQPVAYATDTFLPIVDLGQTGDWDPTGWMRWIDWSVILLGWALTTIFVAGFTRIVRSK